MLEKINTTLKNIKIWSSESFIPILHNFIFIFMLTFDQNIVPAQAVNFFLFRVTIY